MTQSFADHFSSVAHRYRQGRPCYPVELFSWLAEQSPTNGLALDIACGSGQAATELANHFSQVYAIDASVKQLRNAARVRNVDYVCGTAEKLPFRPEKKFDLLTVACALHWLDKTAIQNAAMDLLKPGGLLAVWVYHKIVTPVEQLTNALYDYDMKDLRPYWPAGREDAVDGHSNVQFPKLRELSGVPSFTMSSGFKRDQLEGYLRTLAPYEEFSKDTGIDCVSPVKSVIDKNWPDRDEVKEIRWPISLRVFSKG